jgi:hypothetical protein
LRQLKRRCVISSRRRKSSLTTRQRASSREPGQETSKEDAMNAFAAILSIFAAAAAVTLAITAFVNV